MITPINVKTIHSKHSSLNTIESIVSLADYLGYTALGICDYNFNGANEFFKQTITNEIKPIFSLDLKELIVVVKNTNGFINLSNLEAKNEITFKTLANIQKDLAFIIPQEVSLNNNFSIQKYRH
jgi:DNA polymerase III alpha subunit